MTSSKPLTHCPTCQKPDTWHPDNTSRPFCSGRCKLIDLGEWANETRIIPGPPVTQDEKEDDESNT